MTQKLSIDVYFDLICPWCLIGKRHLNQALAELVQMAPGIEVSVNWHSVQLVPGVPAEGLDFVEFYLQRLGSAESVRLRQGQVCDAALHAGAVVDFARIQRFPNTRQGHQLLAFAALQLAAPAIERLLERLFDAYFNRGEDLNDMATLRVIAAEHGLDAHDLEAWIAAGQGKPEQVQVPGVPLFVFNHKKMLCGTGSIGKD
jgi:predicted DsbA family dithiol-disulfide isomerase